MTLGIAALAWAAPIRPYVYDPAESPLVVGVALAYPLMDLVLAGALIRLVFRAAARQPAYRFLTAGVPVQLGTRRCLRGQRPARDVRVRACHARQRHGKLGSGLGLAIVRRLVEESGGEIWHEARQPRGARFCLRLPAAPA